MSFLDTDNSSPARHPGFITPALANSHKNNADHAKWLLQNQLEKQLRLAQATEDLLAAMLKSVIGPEIRIELPEHVWRHRAELAALASANGFVIAEHETRKDIGMLWIDWSDYGSE